MKVIMMVLVVDICVLLFYVSNHHRRINKLEREVRLQANIINDHIIGHSRYMKGELND